MKENRITIRLGDEILNNVEIMAEATKSDKAKVIRAILSKFFEENDDLLDKYYEQLKK